MATVPASVIMDARVASVISFTFQFYGIFRIALTVRWRNSIISRITTSNIKPANVYKTIPSGDDGDTPTNSVKISTSVVMISSPREQYSSISLPVL